MEWYTVDEVSHRLNKSPKEVGMIARHFTRKDEKGTPWLNEYQVKRLEASIK